MNRFEFCNLLLENRKRTGQKIKEICFYLQVMPNAIYRLEKGANSFNVEFALKYISAIKCYMILEYKNKKHIVRSYEKLVENIKAAREGLYTQRELADQVKMSYTHLANIETSKMIVGIDLFLLLASALNIKITILPNC